MTFPIPKDDLIVVQLTTVNRFRCTSVILALRRLRQEDLEFEAKMSVARPCLKTENLGGGGGRGGREGSRGERGGGGRRRGAGGERKRKRGNYSS
jgi:uncharacterized membrane protein YgcG